MKRPQYTFVTVISICSKDERATVPTNKVYTVKVERAENVESTLNKAWNLTNVDERPFGYCVCSTSVGDIMILDGEHYIVNNFGFQHISAEQSFQVQQLTARDTLMGWEWLVKQGLVK